MVRKRLVSVLLAGALVAGMGLQVNVTVKADDLQDAKNKASEQQDALDAAQAEKNELVAQLDGIVHSSSSHPLFFTRPAAVGREIRKNGESRRGLHSVACRPRRGNGAACRCESCFFHHRP